MIPALTFVVCLNRTSVGLKNVYSQASCDASSGPQSNQRGIENFIRHHPPESIASGQTILTHPLRPAQLERNCNGLLWAPAPPPQSNQRGIENDTTEAVALETEGASIEPAWD